MKIEWQRWKIWDSLNQALGEMAIQQNLDIIFRWSEQFWGQRGQVRAVTLPFVQIFISNLRYRYDANMSRFQRLDMLEVIAEITTLDELNLKRCKSHSL